MDSLKKQINQYIKNNLINNQLDYGKVAGYNNCCINEFRILNPFNRTNEQMKAREILMRTYNMRYIYILCKKCSRNIINNNDINIYNYYNFNKRNKQYILVKEYLEKKKGLKESIIFKEKDRIFLRYLHFVSTFDEYK